MFSSRVTNTLSLPLYIIPDWFTPLSSLAWIPKIYPPILSFRHLHEKITPVNVPTSFTAFDDAGTEITGGLPDDGRAVVPTARLSAPRGAGWSEAPPGPANIPTL